MRGRSLRLLGWRFGVWGIREGLYTGSQVEQAVAGQVDGVFLWTGQGIQQRGLDNGGGSNMQGFE